MFLRFAILLARSNFAYSLIASVSSTTPAFVFQRGFAVSKRNPAKKPKAEPKKKKFGRGPQRAGSGICYNPLCPTRNNYRGAWSCTECRFCPERKFARQSRREIITI